MHPWAERQIEKWHGHGVRSIDDVAEVVADRPSAFAFKIHADVVHCDYKQTDLVFAQRAQRYHELFNAVARRFKVPDAVFAIDVGDEAADSRRCPVFSFQRQIGFNTILLPDIDFLLTSYYENRESWGLPDGLEYCSKKINACFVGSTTGVQHLTRAALDAGQVPRVEAARFFRGKRGVDFFLPNIVQCSDEAAAMLRDEGWGHGFKSWNDQLSSRFIISIDGNGATCSRVYVALASNSVLLKYASGHEMFYFDGLEAGRHYLSIEHHEDVLGILDVERRAPGSFASVAEQGRKFAARHLSQGALEAYTADLIWAYAEAA